MMEWEKLQSLLVNLDADVNLKEIANTISWALLFTLQQVHTANCKRNKLVN